MNHWPYIAAAYGLTLGSTAALLLWSFVAMRRAERAASQLGKRS